MAKSNMKIWRERNKIMSKVDRRSGLFVMYEHCIDLAHEQFFFCTGSEANEKKCRCKREETYSYERIYDLVKFSNFEPLNGSHDDTIARRSMVPSSFAHQWLNHLALGLFLFVYVAFFNTNYTLCVVINSHCH